MSSIVAIAIRRKLGGTSEMSHVTQYRERLAQPAVNERERRAETVARRPEKYSVTTETSGNLPQKRYSHKLP